VVHLNLVKPELDKDIQTITSQLESLSGTESVSQVNIVVRSGYPLSLLWELKKAVHEAKWHSIDAKLIQRIIELLVSWGGVDDNDQQAVGIDPRQIKISRAARSTLCSLVDSEDSIFTRANGSVVDAVGLALGFFTHLRNIPEKDPDLRNAINFALSLYGAFWLNLEDGGYVRQNMVLITNNPKSIKVATLKDLSVKALVHLGNSDVFMPSLLGYIEILGILLPYALGKVKIRHTEDKVECQDLITALKRCELYTQQHKLAHTCIVLEASGRKISK